MPRIQWAPEDIEKARWVWRTIAPGPRLLLGHLLDASGPVPWTELADLLGPEAGDDTVFGSFGNVAKIAKEVGRSHPVKTRQVIGGAVYFVEPTAKGVFNRARFGPAGNNEDQLQTASQERATRQGVSSGKEATPSGCLTVLLVVAMLVFLARFIIMGFL